jgi:hypothetical protein
MIILVNGGPQTPFSYLKLWGREKAVKNLVRAGRQQLSVRCGNEPTLPPRKGKVQRQLVVMKGRAAPCFHFEIQQDEQKPQSFSSPTVVSTTLLYGFLPSH